MYYGYYKKLFFLLLLPIVCFSATFQVTNTNDSGLGSLRQAILDANSAGVGPHIINFNASLSGSTIFILSSLPQITVAGVTIDGDINGDGTGDITIDAGSWNNGTYIFRTNGGGTNTTIKGFTLQDTGVTPLRFNGSPSGVTIEDIVIRHSNGHYIDYGILYNGNASDLTVRNVTMENLQWGWIGIDITGSATNVIIDGYTQSNGGGGNAYGVRIRGVALGVTIQNTAIDLDRPWNSNDGDYGIIFDNISTDVSIDNVTIANAEVYGVYFNWASVNTNITNTQITNTYGWDWHQSIRFNSTITNLGMTNVTVDGDQTGTTNSGEIGVYFNNAVTNAVLTDIVINNQDNTGIYFGNTTNNLTLTNYAQTNVEGGNNAYAIRFRAAATNIAINSATIDLDVSGTTNDGNYGIVFDSNSTAINLEALTIHDAENSALYFEGIATDITLTNSTLDNFNGGSNTTMIQFNNVINGLAINNTLIDLDRTDNGASTDDGEFGIYFNSDINQDLSEIAVLDNVTIKNIDDEMISFNREINNLTIRNSSFLGNAETDSDNTGFVCWHWYRKDNILIENNEFTGIATAFNADIRGASPTSNINILNNHIHDLLLTTWTSTSGAIGVATIYNTLLGLNIIGNTIYNCPRPGVEVATSDAVNISQNAIYNTTEGIYLRGGGNDDLLRNDGDTPEIINSVNLGGDNYDVTFIVPSYCTNCDIEFFANLEYDLPYNGRSYRQIETGLSAGTYTRTINSGGNNTGFWTATLKDHSQNSSVSQYGDKYPINPKGPGNVSQDIKLWLRADVGVTGTTNVTQWDDQSGYRVNFSQLNTSRQPSLNTENKLNFNEGIDFQADRFMVNAGNIIPDNNNGSIYTVINYTDVSGTKDIFGLGNYTTGVGLVDAEEPGQYMVNGNVGWFDGVTSSPTPGSFLANTSSIASSRWEYNVGSSLLLGKDGNEFTATNLPNGIDGDGAIIGATWGEPSAGYIMEVVVYDEKMTGTDHQRVLSHLALKYGITLDQTIPTDYIASDATTKMWDATANSAYNNDIAGIGRDDRGGLLQKQSKSINNGSVVTMGIGSIAATNKTNPNAFNGNMSILMWGNDGGSMALQTTELPATTNVEFRVGREWKVTEAGNVDNLEITFENTVPASIAYVELFIDADGDGDFSNATVISGGTLTGNIARFTGIDLNNGDVFTVGYGYPRTVDFDGINDYIQVVPLMSGYNEASLLGWLNVDESFSDEGMIMGQSNNKLYVKPDQTIEALIVTTTGTFIATTPTPITFGEWVHIASIYNGSTLKVYLNGEESVSINVTGTALAASSLDFNIGRDGQTANRYIDAFMQEVKVYDVALTEEQLRAQIYQPIEDNGGTVRGSIIPKDITGLAWSNLQLYLKLANVTSGVTPDESTSANIATLYNMLEAQDLTAPVPYRAITSGPWTTENTWENGAVWDIENLPNKDWAIVQITNNAKVITTSSHTHLGLLIDAGAELEIQNDELLRNTSYMKLDGLIDLVGQSQLIQTVDSDLDVTSSGSLERDQRGKADMYSYNHWSSPVSPVNTVANNTDYSISGILRDGTNTNSPQPITFITSGYNGSATTPIGLADYWIFKYVNQPDDYGNWFAGHVRSTGNIAVGQGYTQKGPGVGGASQNYVYTGKPNNGTIQHPIGVNNAYLLGNPYPSALDANQFILDNITSTTGTLYFWEHWGGGSHMLAAYQGGYATYNLTGGVLAMSDPDVSQTGSGSIIPQRYVPVGQGFFTKGSATGGTVEFNNDQRAFEKESGGNSTFFNRTIVSSTESSNEMLVTNEDDNIQRVYFRFTAPEGAQRQLLLGVKEGLPDGFNNGYDAKRLYTQITDCAWELDEDELVIQTISKIEDELELPLTIQIANEGVCKFETESLADLPETVEVYFVDKLTHEWTRLEEGTDVVFNLSSGTYADRFYVVFKVKPSEEEIVTNEDIADETNNLVVYYDSTLEAIKLVNRKSFSAKNIKLYNALGQCVYKFRQDYQNVKEIVLPANVATGVYLVEFVYNNQVSITKKIIIK